MADASPDAAEGAMGRAVRDRAGAALADLDLIDEILIAFGRLGGRMDRLSPMFKSEVDEIRADLRAVRGAADQVPADGWAALRNADRDGADLSKRLMSFVSGSLLRDSVEGSQATASRAFDTALALVDELSTVTNITWDREIIPAEREYTAIDTGLIHMVFPRLTVWDLPAVIHEFGHYAGPRIMMGQIAPFNAMRSSGSLGKPAHIEELFADAFATFVGGPAFGCMCAYQRFSPSDEEAIEDVDSHPSHAARVHLILAVLRSRSEEVGDPEWDEVVNGIERTWNVNLQAVGKPTDVPATWQPKLDSDVLRRFRDQVLDRISHARYQSWGRAVALAGRLDPDRQSPDVAMSPGTSLRDILNAGWVARLWWPDQVVQIEQSVSRLLLDAEGGQE